MTDTPITDPPPSTNERTATLSIWEKLGYGIGDAGFNFYWIIIGSYLLYFYTDIFGLAPAAASVMFLVTKIIDACTDPLMGAIADRTNSRWGKFRPYLLFAALPMAAAATLTMSTPDLDDGGKLIWAYATYSIMMLCYTILSTPYSSLSGVLTANTQERNSIYGIRFFFAYLTGIIVGAATPELAAYFAQGNEARGWRSTMLLYSGIATLLFWVSFFSTKERVHPPASQRNTALRDIMDLLQNRPWLILFLLAMIIMLTLTLRGSSSAYYFKYFVERPDLMGSYIGVQMAAYAIGAACTPFLTRFMDKARLLIVLMTIVGILSVAFAFVPKPQATGVQTIPFNQTQAIHAKQFFSDKISQRLGTLPDQADIKYTWSEHQKKFWIFKQRVTLNTQEASLAPQFSQGKVISVEVVVQHQGKTNAFNSADLPAELFLIFILNFAISLALGPKSPLTWSMYADAADYNEWKTGRRATAMTFSAATFSQKLGGAVGSAAIAAVLAAIGYAANQAQTDASQTGIVLLQTAVPGVFAFIAVFALLFYKLDRSTLETIQHELNLRQERSQKRI
ncbi:Inner membrane symporter YicJ [Thalassocella blandensis]|nr:Inner membrane symporter YicJ [Thalassocella blandensis]